MKTELFQVQVRLEAARLRSLPRSRARASFGDRVARAFLEPDGPVHAAALLFNAHLATELREQARAANEPSIWRDL